jgi:hypothetical protein
VLATNNRSCLCPEIRWPPFPPTKIILPLEATEFASIYDNDIHPVILYILEKSGVMTNFKELHPIRMAFNADADTSSSRNPMVLLIIFEHNSITVETAKQIVLAIADKVNISWNSEQYVLNLLLFTFMFNFLITC